MKHNNLYNTLLQLSRNIFFYNKTQLKDNFETRIYLMFIHFSIIMLIYKKKGSKFDQSSYDNLFNNIENNLREMGFGDVTVNKKMKELNKILYDILLKIDLKKASNEEFHLNNDIISKYFDELKGFNSEKLKKLANYFNKFYHFCFELPLDNMVDRVKFFEF